MEIIGIGTDIIEIERIKDAINNVKTFKGRVFTKNEIEHVEKRKNPYPSYAGRFAAKEAVSKAVGTGFRGFNLVDIEIYNDELGKPYLKFYNDLEKIMEGVKFQISISHSKEYAVSTVIFYKEKEKKHRDIIKKIYFLKINKNEKIINIISNLNYITRIKPN